MSCFDLDNDVKCVCVCVCVYKYFIDNDVKSIIAKNLTNDIMINKKRHLCTESRRIVGSAGSAGPGRPAVPIHGMMS